MTLSPERNGRLTASIFAAAMGLNPYMSKQGLYRQLEGIDPPFTGNDATEWGNANESNAVDAYESEFGVILSHAGAGQKFIIGDPDWLGCTTDGFNGDIVTEFKCPYSQKLYEDIPAYYMPQVQGQLDICQKQVAHFCCWTPADFAVWEVKRSDEYIEKMKKLLTRFYDSWKSGVEPSRMKKPTMPIIETVRII